MSDVPARLGKYEIIHILGSGAMGVVYEAVDRIIDRRVAIKTIRNADLDEDEAAEQLRRFLIEARAAGKLNHPHIVSLYDHGEEAGITYLVMELVEGRELQRYFDDGVSFPLGDTVRLMGELLDALGFSHRQGVVHRDVKPDNIFITQAGAVKLGDFGIARIESTQKTRAGLALGTPSHMAPEQIRGEAADGRSDLYAAGVVLFQLLTGRRPFSGTMLSMALKVLNEPAPKPSSLNPQLTPQIDQIVARALEKKAEDRFQTAAEFWLALAETVGLASPAPPPQLDAGDPVSGPRSHFETSAFSNSSFTHSGLGGSNLKIHASSSTAPTTMPATPPTGQGEAKPPLRMLAAMIVAIGLAAFALWAVLRQPAPDMTEPSIIPSTTPSRPASQPAPEPADKPLQQTSPAEPARPGKPDLPASIQPLPAQSEVKQKQVPLPSTTPTEPPPPAPSVKPAPLASDGTRRPAAEAPPSPPARPARQQVETKPAAPVAAVDPPAIVPPPVRPARPGRCSDILLKASLEPLTPDESQFLRRECQ